MLKQLGIRKGREAGWRETSLWVLREAQVISWGEHTGLWSTGCSNKIRLWVSCALSLLFVFPCGLQAPGRRGYDAFWYTPLSHRNLLRWLLSHWHPIILLNESIPLQLYYSITVFTLKLRLFILVHIYYCFSHPHGVYIWYSPQMLPGNKYNHLIITLPFPK
jgi:hypothetical protein